MPQTFVLPKQVVIDPLTGNPAPGAKAYFYVTGTSTPKPVYSDNELSIAITQPVVADAAGVLDVIYLSATPEYKVTLTRADDSLLYTVDPLSSLSQADLTAIGILSAGITYPITPAEAGLTIVQSQHEPGCIRRYGDEDTGDGTQDDTTAVNAAIAYLNAGGKRICGYPGDVYLCSGLTTVTANDTFWYFTDSTIKVKPDSWATSGDGTTHLQITGVRPRLWGLTIDGNQDNFTVSTSTGRLLQWGDEALMIGVTAKESPYQCIRSGGSGGKFIACHFDDNANLGMELDAADNMDFSNCTFERNGYGFQGAFAINGPVGVGFGVALRYRTHHITFTDCKANQNGLDGFATGQGSYAIKYNHCIAWENNDGGFTTHADNLGSGLPGDGEAPYDVELNDCEAYNNWGSGHVNYAASYNFTVNGGRYYNNGRCLGIIAFQSSLMNGVYFAGGAGHNVDTKAYDDRQLCPVTAASGTTPRTVTATGWVAGTYTHYPRVALYNASMAFQGYGTISSESAGSVVITTTANNGVTLASIASGWFITQRTQHNGVMFDNNCQGEAHNDGFGQLIGPVSYSGWKAISGYTAAGQNIILPKVPLDATELLTNPTMDANLTGWSFSQDGSGGSMTHYTGALRRSAGAMELIGGTAGANADATMITDALFNTVDTFVRGGVLCYATNAGDAELRLYWDPGSTFYTPVFHPGGGWRYLRIGMFLPNGNTLALLRLRATAGKTVRFDSASYRACYDATDNRDYTWPTRNLPY